MLHLGFFYLLIYHVVLRVMQGIVNGSYNFQKLAISPDAVRAIYHAKVQLLLILIQSLNLESLLQMIHDNIPFRFCCISSLFPAPFIIIIYFILFYIQEELDLKLSVSLVRLISDDLNL